MELSYPGTPIPTMGRGSLQWGIRGFTVAGSLFLVAWQAVIFVGSPRPLGVWLGLLGFVFHTGFGLWYGRIGVTLDGDVPISRVAVLHLLLSVTGVLALTLSATGYGDAVGIDPGIAALVGAALWAGGVGIFLVALGWTVRHHFDQLLGDDRNRWDGIVSREGSNSLRSGDRLPVLVTLVALSYLTVATYGLLAAYASLPWVGAYAARTTHLLATGAATLVVFVVGFQVLSHDRTMAPSKPLRTLVLGMGTIGPGLIAMGLGNGPTLVAGAILETGAIVGFATAAVRIVIRSNNQPREVYAIAVGAIAGVVGVLLGGWMAIAGRTVGVTAAHVRLTVLGFLGIAVMALAHRPGPVGDRTKAAGVSSGALTIIAIITIGLSVELVGVSLGATTLAESGKAVGLGGAAFHAGLLVAQGEGTFPIDPF